MGTLSQNHFRFGRDNGTESTHTFYVAEDTNTSILVDKVFLLRFNAQESAGTTSPNTDFQFQYSLNQVDWVNITTTSVAVRAVAAASLTNGSNCTKRLSGTGTFESSGAGQTEDGTSGGTANDIAANGCSETECGLQIVSTQVNHGDYIWFRLTSPDFTVTYALTPRLTVVKPLETGVQDFLGGILNKALEKIIPYVGELSFSGIYSRLAETTKTYFGELSFVGGIYEYVINRAPVPKFRGAVTYLLQRAWFYTSSGVLSFAKSLWKAFEKTYDGVLSFTKTLTRTIEASRLYEGAISFGGEVVQPAIDFFERAVDGVLSLAGDISTILFNWSRLQESILSFSGLIRQRITEGWRTFTAILFPSGILSKILNLNRTLTGVLTFAKAIYRATEQYYEGELTFSGDIFKALLKTTTRILSIAGSITRVIDVTKLYFGIISFSSTLLYDLKTATQSFITKTGILSFSKNLIGATGIIRDYLGAVSFSGIITQLDMYLDRLTAAVLTPSGAFTRRLITTRTKRTGILSFVGILGYMVSLLGQKLYSGSLSFSRSISYSTEKINKLFGSVLSSITFQRTKSGILDLGGLASRSIPIKQYGTVGTQAFVGIFSRLVGIFRLCQGVLDFSGAVSGLFGTRFFSGTLSFGKTLTRYLETIRTAIVGNLTPSGISLRYSELIRPYEAALSFTSNVTGQLFPATGFMRSYVGVLSYVGLMFHAFIGGRTRQGVVNFTGILTNDQTVEIMYYGIENP